MLFNASLKGFFYNDFLDNLLIIIMICLPFIVWPYRIIFYDLYLATSSSIHSEMLQKSFDFYL